MSKNYQKTLKKYHKWQNRKNNKIQNAYHQFSKYLVKNYDIIAMENLNIRGMFQNKKWSHKLQKNRFIQITEHDKIQMRMVQKNIHTKRQILPIKQKMQHLRISKKRSNTEYKRMDLPNLQHTPSQRHQCCKKHTKKSTTRTIKKYYYM